MARSYAQINNSLTRSKKLAKLQNHKHRWAYLCVHLSDFCNFAGMFRYPKMVWAEDAGLTVDELQLAIKDMCDVGLIEYDADEQLVRITSWFHKKNCPENASRMIGMIADYQSGEFDNDGMYLNSIAEFVMGCVTRAKNWKSDSPDRRKMHDALGPFARQAFQEFGDDFLACLWVEMKGASKGVRGEVTAICPPLDAFDASYLEPVSRHPLDTVSAPCGDTETDTRRHLDVNETETKTKTNTGQNSNLDDQLQPSAQNADAEVLRMEVPRSKAAQSIKPLEQTKRSALAMKGGHW